MALTRSGKKRLSEEIPRGDAPGGGPEQRADLRCQEMAKIIAQVQVRLQRGSFWPSFVFGRVQRFDQHPVYVSLTGRVLFGPFR
jgi:hypothetical protein